MSSFAASTANAFTNAANSISDRLRILTSPVYNTANAITNAANSVSDRVRNIDGQMILRQVGVVVGIGLALAMIVGVGLSLVHRGMPARKIIPLSIITGLVYSVIIAMFDLYSSEIPINLRNFSGWVKAGIGLALGASVVGIIKFF